MLKINITLLIRQYKLLEDPSNMELFFVGILITFLISVALICKILTTRLNTIYIYYMYLKVQGDINQAKMGRIKKEINYN